MFSRLIAVRGVSLVTRTNLRDSLRVTPAARAIRVSSYPTAILERVFIVHGITIMPSILWVPLETLAAIFASSDTVVARDFTSSGVKLVSIARHFFAHSVIIR